MANTKKSSKNIKKPSKSRKTRARKTRKSSIKRSKSTVTQKSRVRKTRKSAVKRSKSTVTRKNRKSAVRKTRKSRSKRSKSRKSTVTRKTRKSAVRKTRKSGAKRSKSTVTRKTRKSVVRKSRSRKSTVTRKSARRKSHSRKTRKSSTKRSKSRKSIVTRKSRKSAVRKSRSRKSAVRKSVGLKPLIDNLNIKNIKRTILLDPVVNDNLSNEDIDLIKKIGTESMVEHQYLNKDGKINKVLLNIEAIYKAYQEYKLNKNDVDKLVITLRDMVINKISHLFTNKSKFNMINELNGIISNFNPNNFSLQKPYHIKLLSMWKRNFDFENNIMIYVNENLNVPENEKILTEEQYITNTKKENIYYMVVVFVHLIKVIMK